MRWSIVLLAAILVSCAERAPARAPDISGQITRTTFEIIHVSPRVIVLVEAVPSDAAGSPKAVVTVDSSTRIFRANASETRQMDDLIVGATVSVWLDRPVAASYPVQARAKTLIIMTDADSHPAAPPRSTNP